MRRTLWCVLLFAGVFVGLTAAIRYPKYGGGHPSWPVILMLSAVGAAVGVAAQKLIWAEPNWRLSELLSRWLDSGDPDD